MDILINEVFMDFYAFRINDLDDDSYICHIVIINNDFITVLLLNLDDDDDVIIKSVRDCDLLTVFKYLAKIN